jgi:hypothetical protein
LNPKIESLNPKIESLNAKRNIREISALMLTISSCSSHQEINIKFLCLTGK